MLEGLHEVRSTRRVDALVLYTNGMHGLAQPSFLEYVTGVSPLASNNALVLSADGDVIFLLDLPRDAQRVARHGSIDDVRGTKTFDADLVSLLDERSIESLGIAGAGSMGRETYTAVDDAVDSLVSVDDDLQTMLGPKSAEEVAIFRTLGRIADAGFDAVFETARPGVKEYELSAEVEYTMRAAGAEDNFNLFGTGRHNQLMHGPTERVMQAGDVVLCELSPMVEGRVLQICRTVSLGTPSQQLTEKFSLLEQAMAAAKSAMAPDRPASVVTRTMNDVFREAGYEEYCVPPYMRTRGHEFGVGPIGMSITEETETPLREDMVLVIHPNQYIPETGYLALGDPVLVTADGVETLVNTDARLFTKEVR